jgi:acetylornithine deacetylase
VTDRPDILATAVPLLEKLVGFAPVQSGSNLALIDWAEAWLRQAGARVHRVNAACGTKAGLVAQVGPDVAGGVLLSAHSDVVGADGPGWTRDPFCLSREADRLFGRGTSDMLGFAALGMATLAAHAKSGLHRPIQFALSWDEEFGCLGAAPLISHLEASVPKASLVIVGEPSEMRPIAAHKGMALVSVNIRGHAVHSSMLHKGVDAVLTAGEILHWINLRNAENREASRGEGAGFDPPWTSLHCGTVSGGVGHSTTAAHCSLPLTIRALPGEGASGSVAALEAECRRLSASMAAIRPDCGIETVVIFDVPPLDGACNHDALRRVEALCGRPAAAPVSYATEAGIFQREGFEVAICGPGSIAQAHGADEYIDLSQMAEGAHMLSRLGVEST